MEPSLEVLIPVRNPGEVFRGTVDSLLAQTDRGFRVLLSDNYSTSGLEQIAEAERRLREAGIAMRTVRPPWELGRVAHWNWLHHQSDADWLKPLFVGDWLEPECLAVCRETLRDHPEIGFLFFGFRFHGPNGAVETAAFRDAEGPLEARTVAARCFAEGNFFGGPVNVLYRRAAFQAAGGHQTSLPFVADFDLYARLAMLVPAWVLPRVLGNFLRHEQRFTRRGSGTSRESMVAELTLEYGLLRYAAFQAGHPVPGRRFPALMGGLLRALGVEALRRTAGRWKRQFTGGGET